MSSHAGVVQNRMIRQGIARVQAGKLLPINFIASARHNPQYEIELEKKFFDCFAGREKLHVSCPPATASS